jgi:hypothetical protein
MPRWTRLRPNPNIDPVRTTSTLNQYDTYDYKETTMTTVEELERQLDELAVLHAAERQRLLSQIQKLKSRPDEPAEGSVVRFRKVFDSYNVYTYVAVRVGQRWYVSQDRKAIRSMVWNVLLDFVDDGLDTLEVVVGWQRLTGA